MYFLYILLRPQLEGDSMTNGRQIGASFERKIANMLYDELGITFKRDLEQYRETNHGDLVCYEMDFPFVIECKRRAKGTTYATEWWEQAVSAAKASGKLPVLIYQLMRSPIRCVVDLNVIIKAFDGKEVGHQNLVEMPFETFCMIARELINDE